LLPPTAGRPAKPRISTAGSKNSISSFFGRSSALQGKRNCLAVHSLQCRVLGFPFSTDQTRGLPTSLPLFAHLLNLYAQSGIYLAWFPAVLRRGSGNVLFASILWDDIMAIKQVDKKWLDILHNQQIELG
jgi:hypothetical protein